MQQSLGQAALPSQWARLLDLLIVLTQKELRVRYKSYTLGYVWSLLSPMIQAMLFYFVFGVIMRSDVPNFAAFLILSLFVWQWVANSLATAPMNFLGNGPLIKKVPFPHILLVLVNNLQDMIHFILCLPILFALMLWYQIPLNMHMVWGIPILLICQLLLTFSISLIISSLHLFFRDLERIVALVLQFSFYGTPIVYAETSVPEFFKWVLVWNPFAHLVIAWRHLFLDSYFDSYHVMMLIAMTVPIFIVATLIYRTLHWRFAEVL